MSRGYSQTFGKRKHRRNRSLPPMFWSEELRLGAEILKCLKAPVRMMVGEHDWFLDLGERWTDLFGAPTYSFDHKGVHFVVLQSVYEDDFWTARELTPIGASGTSPCVSRRIKASAAGDSEMDRRPVFPIVTVKVRVRSSNALQWALVSSTGAVTDDGDRVARLHAGGVGAEPAGAQHIGGCQQAGTRSPDGMSGVATRVPSASGTRSQGACAPPAPTYSLCTQRL
jgi:hypothetical protein